MKRFFSFKKMLIIALVTVILCASFFTFDYERKEYNDQSLIRIHIRANSNEQKDQDIKLAVRDEIIAYLENNASEIVSRENMLEFLKNNLDAMTAAADSKLEEKDFDYKTSMSLGRMEFPVRLYGDTVVDSGIYDALVIELGEGKGDNWWCIAFPQLCFGKNKNSEPEKKIVVKSRFSEWFKKIRKKQNS